MSLRVDHIIVSQLQWLITTLLMDMNAVCEVDNEQEYSPVYDEM